MNQEIVNQKKKYFGFKTEEKVTNCFNNIHYAVRYVYISIMIYIIGNLELGRNLVNTWQSSELPMVASHIPELINKVKINPEMCCKNRKQYDKSYKNFWYIYKSVITIIWLMSSFLGKQAKRLKCLGLQTTNSCSSNFHTLAKIGANSCQMMEKHLYNSYCKFRNGHSYLEWPILGIWEYLQTTMRSWRHWRLTATPSGNVYKRRTGTLEFLRADSGYGPCQRQVLAEYTNNNNNGNLRVVLIILIPW